ncbi:MAG: ribosome biogenesis GTPase Der [Desulfurivibrionaceae bacterium]
MKTERLPLVALVGRPNVGKSSLFNRLTRKRNAIVDATPGVTRDRHYAKVTWQEQTFILIDTGGIEPLPTRKGDGGKAFPKEVGTDDRVKVVGGIQEQTWQAIKEADVILCLLDGRAGVAGEDYRVADILRKSGKPVFFLVNKIDTHQLEDQLVGQFYELGLETLWPISAAHGYGLNTFMESLVEHLVFPEDAVDLPEGTVAVACIGRPNVGKSSLVNKLLGETRMIVSDVPGTTRDSVDSLLEKDDRSYLLIDTAGLRRRGKIQENLEKFSVMRAISSLERCDVALFLVDAGEGITEQDTKIIGYAIERGRACLILINKWDLVKGDKKKQQWIMDGVAMATNFIGYAPTMTISALTGAGTKKLFPVIDDIYRQFSLQFTTNRVNRVLGNAVEKHTPPLHRGHRLKFYYATQVATKPPTFIVFVNYPKGVHFSYYRYLVNSFREGLGVEQTPLRLILKERQRKKYG